MQLTGEGLYMDSWETDACVLPCSFWNRLACHPGLYQLDEHFLLLNFGEAWILTLELADEGGAPPNRDSKETKFALQCLFLPAGS